ncbi:hypothetical protein HORIV_06280 [Vreelandella olivaria]|uniref:Uncharacterized protein n=1 Tax=Vreelandella olivaria TaxID=390919 RepID=A0ABN5WMR1_9GAMM|nr:hypothetical protein HORIV_06280 [Halomonas olivaria]
MGDMLSLIEEAERTVDKSKADKLAKRSRKATALTWKISATSSSSSRKWAVWVVC